MINIAFCCDKTALPGLYVSLASLLTSQLHTDPDESIRVFIFQEGLLDDDCAGLRKTAAMHPQAELSIRPFSTSGLANLKGLHGNFMPYARLFLADLLPEIDRLIYLDSDLLVRCSIMPIWKSDLGPHLIGAVSTSTIEWSLENRFFASQGLALDDPYLNSGVLLLDLARFRQEGWRQRCLAFLATHKEACQSADQTVLNAFFSRQHLRLSPHFNLPSLPSVLLSPDNLPVGILHFVGAPKPWNFAGKFVHGSGQIFADALRKTAFAEYSRTSNYSLKLRQTLRLAKSYFRTIKWRLQKKNTTLPSI